jgi:hypothetical protein
MEKLSCFVFLVQALLRERRAYRNRLLISITKKWGRWSSSDGGGDRKTGAFSIHLNTLLFE